MAEPGSDCESIIIPVWDQLLHDMIKNVTINYIKFNILKVSLSIIFHKSLQNTFIIYNRNMLNLVKHNYSGYS